MAYLKIRFLMLIVLSGVFSALVGQEAHRALVSFNNDRVFVGVTNFFRVVAQQPGPVRLEQLSATLQTYGEEETTPIVLEVESQGNMFTIHPREVGEITITVQLVDYQEQYRFYASMLDAVSKVGIWGAKTTDQIPAVVFKAQRGLYAQLEGYDICGKCNVIEYKIIRITRGSEAEIIRNNGGNWERATAELILKAQPGDRYIFTNIRYRCPGALVDQLAETLSFELK